MLGRLLFICMMAALFARDACARDVGAWHVSADSTVAWTCRGAACFGLSCGDGKSRLMVRMTGGQAAGRRSVQVDGTVFGVMPFVGQGETATGDIARDHALFDALRRGGRVSIGGLETFALTGSDRAIDAVLGQCGRVARRGVLRPLSESERARNPGGGGTIRHGCELTAGGKEENCTVFDRYANTDIPGFDLRSGIADPLLRGISRAQCEELCVATQGCGAYVHNQKNGKVCFLKSHDGAQARFAGAIAGVMRGRSRAPEALRGYPAAGVPGMDRAAAPRQGETARAFARRMRGLSKPWGGGCSAEWEEMRRVASSLKLRAAGRKAVVGRPYRIGWSLDAPDLRLPFWLSVATPVLARMEGGFVLSPGAVNPFDMAAGAGQTRAMVALWQRDAPTSGTVAVTPLEEGRAEVTVRLQGWVRACEREVVLFEQAVTLEVAPAPAQVVMSSASGNAAYTHAVDLPNFDRRVEFNTSRFRIVTDDGTEIAQRVGGNLAVSPTQRFLTVEQDGGLEIIDVMDGARVGRSRWQVAYWAAGDSLLVTSLSPWGSVTVHAPFSGAELVTELATGPSCCVLAPGKAQTDTEKEQRTNPGVSGHLALDLENHMLSVQGRFGWEVRSLNPTGAKTGENPGSGYNATGSASAARTALALRNLGPVAPVSVSDDFELAGGFSNSFKSFDREGDVMDTTLPALSKAGMRTARLDRQPRPVILAAAQGAFRGATGVLGAGAMFQLDRLGIRPADGSAGRHVLVGPDGKPPGLNLYGREDFAGFRAEYAALFSEVEEAARRAGRQFEWQDHDYSDDIGGNMRECYHFPVSIGEETRTSQGFPIDVKQVIRHDTPGGPIYVASAICSAGATLGSQRHATALGVFDFTAAPRANPVMSAAGDYRLVNTYKGSFWDRQMSSLLYDRRLMLFTPGFGAIAIWDLDAHAFAFRKENLPGGDLLSSAFLTEDRGHVVQVNSDGAIYIHRISDAAIVLFGRIVDDEIAIWTEDHRFDATAEAAARIDLRFPGVEGQFSLDRFGSARRVRGLGPKVLAGVRLRPVDPVDIPPALTGRIGLDGTRILAELKLGPGTAARELRLYQDGVLSRVRPLQANEREVRLDMERLPGARHAAIVAATENGLVSLPVAADLGPDARGGATRRAMMVGVDLYDSPALADLNYAKADADRMRRALTGTAGAGFDLVSLLPDRRATPEAILREARKLIAGLGAGDHAVIFLAGHGLRDAQGGLYFGTTGTVLDDLPGTALAWTELATVLAGSPARVTVLIDACHSGAAGFATNDEVAADLTAAPTNITILSASKGRQLSAESAALGGGLFTLALERVLGPDRRVYDRDGNGRLEADELESGVRAIVHQASGGTQTPWMTRSRMVGRYALF